MPQRTNRFQRLVALLHASLAGQAVVTESAMLKDKVTGEKREVDILIRSPAANYKTTIAIEVVSSTRRADTPWIERMRAKHADLPVDKLVLVSKSGFTVPAAKKARRYDIETLSIQQAMVGDWPLLLGLGPGGIFELTTVNYRCSFILRLEDGTAHRVDAPLSTTVRAGGAIVSLECLVRRLIALPQFRDALYPQINCAVENEFWLQYTEPSTLREIEYQDGKATITELWIGLKVIQRQSFVSMTTGSFQSAPFVFGATESEQAVLQFVLVKKPDGQVAGCLRIDGDRFRS